MEILNQLFGLYVDKLSLLQMLARAFFVFFTSLALIRVAGQRTLGTQNAFDQLTMLISGAVLGRSIVSAEQPFFESMGAVLLIVLLHRLVAWATYKSKILGLVFKGKDISLVINGKFQKDAMAKTLITEEDVNEAMRLMGNIDSLSQVKEARLERAGEVSIVRYET